MLANVWHEYCMFDLIFIKYDSFFEKFFNGHAGSTSKEDH